MSARGNTIIDAVLRTAGGNPETVRALAVAFRKADDGRAELQRRLNPRRNAIPPSAVRILLLLFAVLGSVVLSIVMAKADGPLPLGPLIISGLHWLFTVSWLVGRAGPALLTDDDRLVLGWWPVSPRDLFLARVLGLLRESLVFAAALAGLPLFVLVFTGQPPLLAALLFGAGLVVQAVAMVFGVFITAALLVRWLGRDKAQRLAVFTSDGNAMVFFWMLFLIVPRQADWIGAHADLLAWLPPLWAGLWAAPSSPATFLRGVALLSLMTAPLVVVGTRLAGAAAPAATAPSRRPTAGARHWTDLIEGCLGPWLPGIEGWVTRRLLVAHLRNDWRFLASALAGPLMFAFMIFVAGSSPKGEEDVSRTALMAIRFSFWIPFLAPTASLSMLGSSRPEALWPVALADLDAGRLLAAQRRVGRVILLLPMLAFYGIRAFQVGAPWAAIATDILLLAVLWEAIVLLMQERVRSMSFSRKIGNQEDLKRAAMMILSLVISLGSGGLILAYATSTTGGWIAWSITVLFYAATRWNLRRVRGTRLRMDLIPD